MKRAIVLYKEVSSLWICVAVYLWALELRAVIGTDSEPVASWLADCAAILLTMVFWVALFAMALALAGGLVGRERFVAINRIAVKICLIVVTALHFIRWLFNWQIFSTKLDVGLIVLTVCAAVLTILAIKRRRQKDHISEPALPSLEDCFAFAAMPVLIASIALIAVRVSGELIASPQGNVVLASDSRPAGSIDNRSSVILIVSDAMRAGSMSLYGHTRSTTPQLDRWSETATVFLEAHVNSTSTKPSMTTILTGKHPLSHGRLTKAQPPDRSDENLLRLLRDHGYFVGAVTSNEDASINLLGFNSYLSENEIAAFESLTLSWLRRHGIHPTPTGGRMYQNLAHFLWFLGYPEKTSYYGDAEDSLRFAKQFIARARRPFFLALHIHEPHDPYDAPAPFRGSYSKNSAAKAQPDFSSSQYGRYDERLQPSVDFYRDQYEESVSYLDAQLGEFLQATAALVPNENYAVIFTADHGESFERGYMNHGEELYETSTHVPLVVRFPNQSRRMRLAGLAQSVDIAPTILSIAGIEVPEWMDGRALDPIRSPLAESAVAINFKDPVGQTTYALPTKAAIWSKPYKLIQNCESGRAMLYNWIDDRREEVDLAPSAPAATMEKLRSALKTMLGKQSKGPKMTCAGSGG